MCTPYFLSIHFMILIFQVTANFWQTWKEFEIRHGNEDTIREMLRIKRSVQATYNTQVNFMSSQMLKATTSSTGTGERACTHLLNDDKLILSLYRELYGLYRTQPQLQKVGSCVKCK